MIDGSGLILDTGSNTIVNQGLIEGSVGTLTVHSTMNNAGLIDAYRGVVHLEGRVDNSGTILAGRGGRGGGAGQVFIDSAVDNAGTIEAAGSGMVYLDNITQALSGTFETSGAVEGPAARRRPS